jgi:predicted nucleotidyltransferase
MSSPLFHSLNLPEEIQDLLKRYLSQITETWSTDLGGLLLFGSAARGDFIVGRSNINMLVLVRSLSVDLLQRAGKLHQEWGKHQIVAPLLLTEDDLVRSGRFFPLETLQISQHHVVLAGHDPFVEFHFDRDRLAWQCEQELMANLLRLRQRFIEGAGRIEAIQALLLLSITAVLPCIRGLLHIMEKPSKEKDVEVLEHLPDTLQFDPTTFLDILHIKRGLSSPGSLEWSKTFFRYLQNLELFLKRIEVIREEGRL